MADSDITDKAESATDKDVPMEELGEKIVDELLSGDKDETSKSESKDEENDEAAKKEKEEKKRQEEEEQKKKEEEEERKKRDEEEDAASDAEIEAEDDRSILPGIGEQKWQWHIEIYPLATEDMLLENFSRLCGIAAHSQVVFREPQPEVKKGEAHFYANDLETAKTIVRTLCCKRLAYHRPYIYIYRKKTPNKDDFETAVMRLDLLEVAKVRWDKQKKAKGEPNTRIAKVTKVPTGTSRDLLRVVFARAYRVKMDTVMSAADTKKAKAAKAAREKAKAKGKEAAKAAKAEANNANEEDEDEDSDSESEEEEELFGRFEGSVTVDCCTRASLKGFMLGYRKVAIGQTLVDIKPLSSEEINVEELRKEARKRRWDEAVNGPTWIPVPPKTRFVREEWGPPEYYEKEGGGWRGGRGGFDRGRGGFDRGRGGFDRGRGGFDRGRGGFDRGRGGRGGSDRGRGGFDRGRGGREGMIKTGRQSYEEKTERWGGGGRGRGRGGYEGGYGRGGGGYGGYGRDVDQGGYPPRRAPAVDPYGGYGEAGGYGAAGYDYDYGGYHGYEGGYRDQGGWGGGRDRRGGEGQGQYGGRR